MKALSLLMSLLTVFALNAKADQPTLDPMPAAKQPLAQVWVGGGMPAPGGLASTKITVTTDGHVDVVEKWFPKNFGSGQPGETKSYQLPKLHVDTLLKLQLSVAAVKGGKLVTPTEPGCMDAPSTEFSAFQNGKKIVVYKISECRRLPLEDESQRPAADIIRDILSKLLAFTGRR